MANRNIKAMALVVLVVACMGGIWWLNNYNMHKGMIALKIEVLPPDSKLTIDNKEAKPGKVYVTPGFHTLKASRLYFDDASKTINTAVINTKDTVYLLPGPNSVPAKKWLSEHPDIQRDREAVGGDVAIQEQKNLEEKYPIIKQLPHENLHYKIDYSLNKLGKLELTITLYAIINKSSQHDQYIQQLQQYKAEALSYLSSKGVKPGDYKITYIPPVQ